MLTNHGNQATSGHKQMFCNREDAAHQLAQRLIGRKLHDPLVLAIPRGGVVTGAVLARELGADLDVVLSRKLRAPMHPELPWEPCRRKAKSILIRLSRKYRGWRTITWPENVVTNSPRLRGAGSYSVLCALSHRWRTARSS